MPYNGAFDIESIADSLCILDHKPCLETETGPVFNLCPLKRKEDPNISQGFHPPLPDSLQHPNDTVVAVKS